MQDSTEEAIFLSSSGDAEILRPSKAPSRQECCGEVRSFTRPAGKGMYARGKGGYAYGFASHPQTILVPYDCWQSDEVHPGCAWIEVVAPAGKALAQLQDYFLRHHQVFQQQVLASLQHSRLSDELTATDLGEASASIVAVPRSERGLAKHGSSKVTWSRQGSHLSSGDGDTEPLHIPSLRSPHHSPWVA
eukprot:s1566_g4.t1